MGKHPNTYLKRSPIFALMILILSITFMGSFDHAHGISEKKKLQKERSRLIDLKKKSEKAKKELEKTIHKQKKLKKDVSKLKNQLKKEVRSLKRVDKELRYVETLIGKYDQKMTRLESRKTDLIKGTEIAIQSIFFEDTRCCDPVSSFMNRERRKYIALLLLSELNHKISGVIDEEQKLEHKVVNLEDTRKYWENRQVKTANKKKSIERKRKTRERELTKIESERKRIESRYRKLQKNSATLQKTVAAIEKKLRRKSKGGKFSKTIPSGYTFPAQGTVVSRFGRIKDKDFNVYVDNKGIEIKGRPGGRVRAVDNGVVVYQGDLSGFGLVTVIEHRGDIFTVYAKAALYNVKVGDKVKKGQKIGVLKRKGSPVVYFELRVGGKPVNPLKYIKIPQA